MSRTQSGAPTLSVRVVASRGGERRIRDFATAQEAARFVEAMNGAGWDTMEHPVPPSADRMADRGAVRS